MAMRQVREIMIQAEVKSYTPLTVNCEQFC